ncbi:hypothetical protein A2773_04365 [Candidatus Gottesmanbacteria bacterium RIFCSPHIGHO2_01_FULL_39_10]|uniref:GH18 domain-containing protein n=1 Tax=Candidatus Gottesmanbacteria bacterium RIFCSPHIGHO2_01_FULL_39_10 TaxID=1798375 RepID=A0A1F5ZSL7_9BACT|nr:MAG: hypothetical protein A2773_04365 [Candidatus Gottesmanbacteria bacterium RIFCSPHIGHO2_01_FULL_39_10]
MLPNNPKVFAPQKFVWKDPDHNPLLTKFISILLYFSCFIIIFMGILTRVVIPKAQAASISPIPPISQDSKPKYEVFGFAPHWLMDERMNKIDFTTLTTMAYFGIPVKIDGSLDKNDRGYKVFHGKKATELFKKAHENGTRVVLTLTLMKNDPIKKFLDDEDAWANTAAQASWEVLKRGIDGVNIDFEYVGSPGTDYKNKFSKFVNYFTKNMHKIVPNSQVTVSVYASAVKDPKIYDIKRLGEDSDGIFMMAYDFATTTADKVMPTAPLGGHKEGKYWYDIRTAVNDFLSFMPEEKLILGLPWYGYNYQVSSPQVKASTSKGYYTYQKYGRRTIRVYVPVKGKAQPYYLAQDLADKSGWDEYGQVGWKAYNSASGWRMIFLDDEKSLSLKYDFAKEKKLKGIGMWALGFDNGDRKLWDVIQAKFGQKTVDEQISQKQIYENI